MSGSTHKEINTRLNFVSSHRFLEDLSGTGISTAFDVEGDSYGTLYSSATGTNVIYDRTLYGSPDGTNFDITLDLIQSSGSGITHPVVVPLFGIKEVKASISATGALNTGVTKFINFSSQ